jgi:hypothetical protein
VANETVVTLGEEDEEGEGFDIAKAKAYPKTKVPSQFPTMMPTNYPYHKFQAARLLH